MRKCEEEMKERPIIFSGPMARAILDGKTQTRRIVKPQPQIGLCTDGITESVCFEGGIRIVTPRSAGRSGKLLSDGMGDRRWVNECCPYGKPGDRLWVRETWAATGPCFESLPPKAISPGAAIWYMADGPKPDWGGKTRVSIHMPRWASRILLEIINVRVERLQSISEADAVAEGIERSNLGWRDYRWGAGVHDGLTAVNSYRSLWERINDVGSWDANPYVWVVEFQIVEQRE